MCKVILLLQFHSKNIKNKSIIWEHEYHLDSFVFQALLKLNRKLQPMVDGIDANRNKWQDLCSSYQQTRRALLPNQSVDTDQSPESHEDAESSQQPASAETLKPVENSTFGARSKCSHEMKCRVGEGSCDDKPASAGNVASAGKM